jgi:hypothetical protein
MTNYTPTSLLTSLSKVPVKVMYNRLSQNTHCNNILVPEQFGLGEGTATEDAAHKLPVGALKSINKK